MSFIVTGWVVFLFLIWLPVERAHSAFCFNNYDLGIYGQALTLLSIENPNPYLSTRDVRLFNDHFDPILFLLAPLAKVVEPALLAIRVEMFCIVLASAAPIWLWSSRLISKSEMIAVFFIILFSPMTLTAALYPSHPGTWALAPLAWMLAFLYAKRNHLALIMLLFLMCCKEEFPLVGGILGMLLILQNRKRVGYCFFFVSAIWFLAVFFLRPIILGKSDYYTSSIMMAHGLTGAGFGSWLLRLFELVFMVFAPVLLMRASRRPSFNTIKSETWLMLCASVVVVLILIRVIGGYWGNHRAAPLAVMAGFMIIGMDYRVLKMKRLRRVLFYLVLVGMAAPSLEIGGRVWRDKPFKKHCPATFERIQALNEVVSYLESVEADRVLAGGNIVPHLVRRPGVSQIGATKSNDFRFYVVEKYQSRNSWPLNPNELQSIDDEWRRRPGIKVLRDDDYVLFLEQQK